MGESYRSARKKACKKQYRDGDTHRERNEPDNLEKDLYDLLFGLDAK